MSTDSDEQVLDFPFRAPGPLEPPEEWARLREGCPVAHVRLPSGDKAVLLTRYSDVRQLLSDPRFSRILRAEGAARVTANQADGPFAIKAEADTISNSERHQTWRRMIMPSFNAKRIAVMQQRIEAFADQLVDEMTKQGCPADVMSALAFPLTVWVMGELLGIPGVDRDKLAYWSSMMISLTKYTKKEIDEAIAEFSEYIEAHITEKRANLGDDLLSKLIAPTDEGQKLSEQEVIFTCRALLVAGQETTSNMIGKMVAMLLADRRRWEQLLANPSLVRTAVEEVMRFDPISGFGIPRFITEDVELGGQTLPRGTTVICKLASANRDEQAFDHAHEMDLARTPNAHLTFGIGPYSCVGHALARTELQTALSVLLRRLPTLELAVPAEALPRREGFVIGGLERVLVRW